MFDIEAIVGKHIKEIEPYIAGKPIAEVARQYNLDPEKIIKLASNENPLGPSTEAVKAMEQYARRAHRYPDDSGYPLRTFLSKKLGVPTENIILGHGSVELIVQLCHTFVEPGEIVVSSQYSFAWFKLAAHHANANFLEAGVESDYCQNMSNLLKLITPKTKLVFIAVVNNPTGTMVTDDQLRTFLEQVPNNVLVVLDEAYLPLVEDRRYPDTMHYLQQYENVILLRTFSKIGLADPRIGYLLANSAVIDALFRTKLSFNASTFAQEAAMATLEDEGYLGKTRKLFAKERPKLATAFKKMGLSFVQPTANFFLVHFPFLGKEVFQRFLKHGIIIRPMDDYHLPHHCRISIGLPEENDKLIQTLPPVLDL